MSALLDQKLSQEADQLHKRLPRYVPTAIKNSLTHLFKVHTSPPLPQEVPRSLHTHFSPYKFQGQASQMKNQRKKE